ncbi:hypothetical protein GCM10027577_06250 [Spirosoma fluminis]
MKLDVTSVALVYGAVLAVFGLFIALMMLAFGSILSLSPMLGRSGMGMMMRGGMFAAIFLPVFYGLLGLIFGALFAVVYNLVAPRVGGIKVYIRDVTD